MFIRAHQLWNLVAAEMKQSPARSRSSHQRFSVKKGVLQTFAKFTGQYLCQNLKAVLAQVFPCEFSEIFESSFCRTPTGDFSKRCRSAFKAKIKTWYCENCLVGYAKV